MLKDPSQLKTRQEEYAVWGYLHRWTIARALWESGSPFEFRRLWQETPQYVIANYSFEKFVENGRSEDVDDFAEIFLSLYLGRDATREFMSTKTRDKTAMSEGP
jgi:hypothetical protein